MENGNFEMTIESLKLKVENQQRLIREMTTENDELYHQYNHLIIRNGKMLKRIDDLQKIIDDLHIRIEELQLINGNMMTINDKLRRRPVLDESTSEEPVFEIPEGFDEQEIVARWKNFPGQTSQNGPNLRKQVRMLMHLYFSKSLSASELFARTNAGGVTGARYVSILKKAGLIEYRGARKKGRYEITENGKAFIENRHHPAKSSADVQLSDNELPQGIPLKANVSVPAPVFDANDL